MESEVHYKRVGFFLLLGVVLLVSIVFWLSGISTNETVDRYLVYFEKQSLDGLQKDSLVTMKGIRVGVVEDYQISKDNIQRVKVVLRLDHNVPIKTNTRAVIRRNLLTGLAKIDLQGGTQSALFLTTAFNSKDRSPEADEFPVIPEEVTQMEKIADGVPDLLEKIDEIAAKLTRVLSEDNMESVAITLKSLGDFSSELASAAPALAKTVENLEAVTARASKAMEKVSGANDDEGVVHDLAAATEEMRILVGEVRQLTSEFGPSVRTVSRSVGRMQRDINNISRSVNSAVDAYGDPQALISEKEKK